MYTSQEMGVLNVTMQAIHESSRWLEENSSYDDANFTAIARQCRRQTLDVFSLQFACDVVIGLPLVAVGIVANILSFVVLSRHKNRMTTTVLLQALAVCDTLILMCILLLRGIPNIHVLSGTDVFSSYINVHYPSIFVSLLPVMYFLRLTETWLTTLITVDRYIAVCHPLHAQRLCTLSRAYKNMATVIVLAFVFSAPRFFEQRLTDATCHGITRTSLLDSHVYTIFYQVTLFSVVMYAVPMSLLVGLNCRLLWELRRTRIFRPILSHHTKKPGTRQVMSATKSVTLIVVTVVLVCIVCNLIAVVTHIMWSLHRCFTSLRYLVAPRRTLSQLGNVMITLNSAINFFIYCVCSRNFRREFVATFRCRHMRKSSGSPAGSAPSTDGTQLIPMCSVCGKRSSVVVANGALCCTCTISKSDTIALVKTDNTANGSNGSNGSNGYDRTKCYN